MENFNDTLELQEMREQLNLLNRKLEKEHIVNEQILRKAMGNRISNYKQGRWLTILIPIIVIPCFVIMYQYIHISLTFILVTAAFLIAAIYFTFYGWKNIQSEDFLSGNLCETSKKLIHLNRLNAQWRLFAIPFGILWFVWYLLEIYPIAGENSASSGGIIGGIVGGIIGVVLGTIYYKNRKKAIDETIKQIEEITKE